MEGRGFDSPGLRSMEGRGFDSPGLDNMFEILNEEMASEDHDPDDMGWIRDFLPSAASDSWRGVSLEERALWAARGAEVLNTPMVSAVCDDADLNMALVSRGRSVLAEHGVEGAIEIGLSGLRFAGLGEAELRDSMDGYQPPNGPQDPWPTFLCLGELRAKRGRQLPAVKVVHGAFSGLPQAPLRIS